MALLECRNKFSVLRNSSRFSLIVPDDRPLTAGRVLWLLPVAGGTYSDWVRYTRVERLAAARGLTVILPEGLRSDFADMAYGMLWRQYLTEELPAYLEKVFGLEANAPGALAFGAGMGGLGALKLGLFCPGRFAAVGAADADLGKFARYETCADRVMEDNYGKAPIAPDVLAVSDPAAIAGGLDIGERLPAFYLEAGDAYASALGDTLVSKGACVRYLPAQARDWDGREAALLDFLDNIPICKEE